MRESKSVIARVCFSQLSVIFDGDLAALCISGASVIARCPQGETRLYFDSYMVTKIPWPVCSTKDKMATIPLPFPGSEIVRPAELRKREDENKTPRQLFVSSPLSESLEQANNPADLNRS